MQDEQNKVKISTLATGSRIWGHPPTNSFFDAATFERCSYGYKQSRKPCRNSSIRAIFGAESRSSLCYSTIPI